MADLGCGGHGHFVFPMAKLVGPHGHVYAVDIQQSVLNTISRQARLEGLEQIHTVWSDVEHVGATSIPEGTLDRASYINTLFQVKQKEQALREARRLLKKGGELLVVDWAQHAALAGPSSSQRVAVPALLEAAKRAGFRAEAQYQPGKYHFSILFSVV